MKRRTSRGKKNRELLRKEKKNRELLLLFIMCEAMQGAAVGAAEAAAVEVVCGLLISLTVCDFSFI